jgi:6-hydroxycyclohex-1-ene-1-carbonyl-CoA dehydrogenase
MPIAANRWLFMAPGQALERAEFVADTGPDEVVVAVAGCGVCHTDLGYYYDGVRTNQPLPLAWAMRSAAAWWPPARGQAWLGSAVIVPAVLPCGECDLCRRGLATICRSQKMPGNDIQGGFGSHIVVPARAVSGGRAAPGAGRTARWPRCPSWPTR